MIKIIVFVLAVTNSTFLTPLALAQVAEGHWAVIGNVEGKAFTLDCQFQQVDQNLSGACIDGPTGDATVKGGRSHALIEGHMSGENISWTYESSYLFIKFNVVYAGVIRDEHISGTIAAAGKMGTFTADRLNH